MLEMVVGMAVVMPLASVERVVVAGTPELAVEGLRVVAFPLGGTVLLPGEVLGGKELELEMVVGEEGEGPAVSVVFMAAVEDKGAVVDAAVSGEVLVVFG